MGFWQGFVLITTVHLLAAAAPGPDFVMVTQQTLLHGKRTGWWCSLGIALGLGVHIAYSIFGLAATIAHSQPLLQAIRLAGGSYLLFLGWQSLRSSWPRQGLRDRQTTVDCNPSFNSIPVDAQVSAAAADSAYGTHQDASTTKASLGTARDTRPPVNQATAVPLAASAAVACTPQRGDAPRTGIAGLTVTAPASPASITHTPSARRSLLKGFFCNVLNPKAPLYFVSLFTVVLSPKLPLAQLLLYGLWMMVLQLAWFSAVALLLSQPLLQAAFMRGRHWVDRACGVALGLLGLRVLALLR